MICDSGRHRMSRVNESRTALIVGAGLYVLVRQTRAVRRPVTLSECRGSGPG